jgi:hypothetical protein
MFYKAEGWIPIIGCILIKVVVYTVATGTRIKKDGLVPRQGTSSLVWTLIPAICLFEFFS